MEALTGVIAQDMFDCLEQEKLLSEEQKGCIQGSYGKKVQLLKYRNLSRNWIDYKKAYEFVLHSWINECMKLIGIADHVKNLLEKSMEQWKLSLTTNAEDLGEVDVKKGIFQGDSYSPLLFVWSMVPLLLILMEFGMKKHATIKRGNVVRCKGIKLPNSEVMKKVQKEG